MKAVYSFLIASTGLAVATCQFCHDTDRTDCMRGKSAIVVLGKAKGEKIDASAFPEPFKGLSCEEIKNVLGIRPAKDRGYYGLYHSPMREDRRPSMKVDYKKNLWIDYGAGDGGTLIDLVMRLEKCDAGQAMRLMEQNISGISSFSFQGNNTPVPPQREAAITIEKVQPLENPALIAYLNERGINIDIARVYCPEVHYSVADKPYYAVGFRNDAGGYELRSKYFKGCTSKAPTTKDSGHEDCLVFEGFMNYLSFMTLKGNPQPGQNTVVLNSVTNLGKAKPFIASHERVYAYLDNDDAGRKATAELKAICKNLSDQSAHYQPHNDLNAYLKSRLSVNRRYGARAEQTSLTQPSREEEKTVGLKRKSLNRGRKP